MSCICGVTTTRALQEATQRCIKWNLATVMKSCQEKCWQSSTYVPAKPCRPFVRCAIPHVTLAYVHYDLINKKKKNSCDPYSIQILCHNLYAKLIKTRVLIVFLNCVPEVIAISLGKDPSIYLLFLSHKLSIGCEQSIHLAASLD